MSEPIRYLCVARLNGTERVFLWEGEDPGPARVIVDEQGFVLSFSSIATAMEAAQANGWNVASEEPTRMTSMGSRSGASRMRVFGTAPSC